MTDHNMIAHNEGMTRFIVEAPFGVACYEGKVIDGKFIGKHAGVCEDWDSAYEWLEGETPESMIQVFPKYTVH